MFHGMSSDVVTILHSDPGMASDDGNLNLHSDRGMQSDAG